MPTAFSLLLLAGAVPAQVALTVLDAQPVPPGVPFRVLVQNNTGSFLGTGGSNDLVAMLQPSGELITPELVGCGPVAFSIAPGGQATVSLTPPGSGPGSAGSFLLVSPHGGAARVDVGAASAAFPDIHAYPPGIAAAPVARRGHHVTFPGAEWELANTGSTNHTFFSAFLDVFTPGATSPVASASLAGITVPAGGVTRVPLPLSGPAGPYTVRVQWVDPAAGPQLVRHGVEASPSTIMDLHLPGGSTVSVGGKIPVRVTMSGFPVSGFATPTANIAYAVVLTFQPGSSPMPGGAIFAGAFGDPLVHASLTGGLGGLLTGNVGRAEIRSVFCAHSLDFVPEAKAEIGHHGIPALSGLELGVTAVAVDDQGNWGASQGERVVFQ